MFYSRAPAFHAPIRVLIAWLEGHLWLNIHQYVWCVFSVCKQYQAYVFLSNYNVKECLISQQHTLRMVLRYVFLFALVLLFHPLLSTPAPVNKHSVGSHRLRSRTSSMIFLEVEFILDVTVCIFEVHRRHLVFAGFGKGKETWGENRLQPSKLSLKDSVSHGNAAGAIEADFLLERIMCAANLVNLVWTLHWIQYDNCSFDSMKWMGKLPYEW